MGYNATKRRNSRQRHADAARMGSAARCAGNRAPLQRKAFSQRVLMVLAEDYRRAHIKASLASDRLRQLRDLGRFRFAGEAARS